MNKIVCDVCGMSYPETAEQCPICGTAKTDAAKSAADTASGYAYVKGGRFSHSNVRKRNAGKKDLPRVVAPAKTKKEAPAPRPRKEVTAEQKPAKQTPAAAPAVQRERPVRNERQATPTRRPAKKSNRWSNIILALIAFLLVVAIVAVVGYLVKGFIDGRKQPGTDSTTSVSQNVNPTVKRIACTGVKLALNEKTFRSLEDKFYLSVTLEPVDTTDTVHYESADEQIATVDEKGIVRPVSNGQTVIYIYCGDAKAECYITCEVGVDPTKPTDPSDPTNPEKPEFVLTLKSDDIMLYGYGDSAIIYNGEVDASEINWTSSDEEVATVANGKVIAVGNGNAIITAEYMGQTATCVVRCTNVVITNYELRTKYGLATDFTIRVGDTIKLYMVEIETDLRVNAEELTFTLSKEGVITIDESGKITAVGTGTVTITVTYGETTLKCKVRVSAPKT